MIRGTIMVRHGHGDMAILGIGIPGDRHGAGTGDGIPGDGILIGHGHGIGVRLGAVVQPGAGVMVGGLFGVDQYMLGVRRLRQDLRGRIDLSAAVQWRPTVQDLILRQMRQE